ncbi:MAG TPA: DoxX family protein [Candidatus Baltobacterales bacterium]|nr:DoxX family protein [Candidatus Baltobacterales bacterium]
MNTFAWVLQVVLAVLFLVHGLAYTVAYGAFAKRMQQRRGAASPLPPAFRQFIGVAELAAAFGLIVPPALHLFSWLAPLAAAGLVIVMVGAVIFHARRSEFPALAVSVVLVGLAAVTVFLRWQVVPL